MQRWKDREGDGWKEFSPILYFDSDSNISKLAVYDSHDEVMPASMSIMTSVSRDKLFSTTKKDEILR